MIKFTEHEFLELLKDDFSDEIIQNDLKFKLLKLNSQDVLIFINRVKDPKLNCTVMNTNIKFQLINEDTRLYEIFIYDDTLESLYTKIKRTIFNICLVK